MAARARNNDQTSNEDVGESVIQDRIREAWAAVETLQEEAYELPESNRRDIALNVCQYIKGDLKMVAHQFGMKREDLVV